MKMKILWALILLVTVATSGHAVTKQAESRGATKIDVPNGADVDALTVDQNDQGQSAVVISSGGFNPWSVPKSLFSSLPSAVTGQMVYCRDCTAGGRIGAICFSSGTLGNDAFTLSTGTKCGAGL
jgi:hypothetical protein